MTKDNDGVPAGAAESTLFRMRRNVSRRPAYEDVLIGLVAVGTAACAADLVSPQWAKFIQGLIAAAYGWGYVQGKARS